MHLKLASDRFKHDSTCFMNIIGNLSQFLYFYSNELYNFKQTVCSCVLKNVLDM